LNPDESATIIFVVAIHVNSLRRRAIIPLLRRFTLPHRRPRYLLKGCTRDELIKAITTAATGESLFTREELRRVSGALATPRLEAGIEVALTKRESEVLKQLASGATNKEIAITLHVSYETVKEHAQHIFRKIGVTDRTQAAVWAVRKELA
jgi:DNA-binding NarL/FixJ family response regulator